MIVSTALTVILAILVLVAVLVLLAVRSHLAWRAKQTVAGVWEGSTPEGRITLRFEGGPHEGSYEQVAERGGASVRESGHWQHSSGKLQLLIQASDEKDNPEFGVSTPHVVRFLAPGQIGIEGPRRPATVYTRAS